MGEAPINVARLGRYNDPQGDHYGVSANVSASFTGGSDADTFAYGVGAAELVTLTDFEDGVDRLFLRDNHHNANVPLESPTITDVENDALIRWNGISDMLLVGVSASQLSLEDFVSLQITSRNLTA